MAKLSRRSSNSSSGSYPSKGTSENSHFLKQCFIWFLVISSDAWFTHLIHCRISIPWIISDDFFPLPIFEITCFKSCMRYLTLKFQMMPASQDCNWEVVFLDKNKSLIFLRFFWRILGWDGALSGNSMTFRFSICSLQSKAERTWVMISLVIHVFAVKILHTIRFRKIWQFWKALRDFTLSSNNKCKYVESTRGHRKYHSKSLFWFRATFTLFFFFANPTHGRALERALIHLCSRCHLQNSLETFLEVAPSKLWH